jgi:hypothetical protein
MRNYRRKRRAHTNIGAVPGRFWERREDPSALDDIAAFEQQFDAVWVRARLSALIREAARVFPRGDLRCYFLMEVHGMSVDEVSERVGVSRASTFAKRRAVADWFLAVGPRFFASWEQ